LPAVLIVMTSRKVVYVGWMLGKFSGWMSCRVD
jgi:hypothetical protein